ncbi:hypothetical protein FOA43_004199 [Brettanomyces nanus]|uniref:Uncharacterized protein n=1 Tax=Eeniella nana TaxID=13502 RepID=A0A875S9I8_EENNA|nr:uncharacterized protein FOA43_004199 [Brettanomyces nanus]QPG76805.1 hypothetical protein FOA43_004199 [Brettanomyces nanus]
MVFMILVIVILPRLSGVATYVTNPDYIQKRKDRDLTNISDRKQSEIPQSSSAYIPPDEDDSLGVTTATSEPASSQLRSIGSDVYQKVKEVKITGDDIPIKLSLANEEDLRQQVRRRDKASSAEDSVNSDPNKYDYDLDELITQESTKDRKDAIHEASDWTQV